MPKKTDAKTSKIRIRLRSYDHKLLDLSTKQIADVIQRHQGEIRGPVPLPTEMRRYTVNRSPFIYKNAREQFEMRIHKRLIDVLSPNQQIIEALGNLNLPAGVEIEIKVA